MLATTGFFSSGPTLTGESLPPPLSTNDNQYHRRSLQQQTGIEACSDCIYANGHECVGRTVTDDNCSPCTNGQTYWPCDVVLECWCWDTSKPRNPLDDAANTYNEGGGEKVQACKGCGALDTEECVGNQNSLTPTSDEDCAGCMNGQSYWPCDVADLCWCWDTTQPKKPPAPASGFQVALDVRSPCEVLTEDIFHMLAPNATFPYTYDGLCTAIDAYNNAQHTEKFAAMGNDELIRAELAAFLGNTMHESDDYEAAREYLACGDRKEVEGKVYCKPCTNDQYNWTTHTCLLSMVAENSPYNSYCQSTFMPPNGCACNDTTQVEEEGELAGYIDASKVFYGRGAIQLSWNYNYNRASIALTGIADTFCNDPEQIATSAEYTWGTAIFFWMENVKEEWTCHKEIMMNEDFGGTLSNINGGLECPAYKGGWHHSAIKMRLNRYCHAASLLGMTTISSLDGCSGMSDTFEECLADGQCPFCYQYADGLPNNTTNSTRSEITMEDLHEPEKFTSLPVTTTSSMPTSIPSMPTLSSPPPSLNEDSKNTHTPTIQESSTAFPSDAIKTLVSTIAPTLTPSTHIRNSPSSRMPSTSSPTTAMPTLTSSEIATEELIKDIVQIDILEEEDWSEASITSATILRCGETQEDALKNYCISEGNYDCSDGVCFNGLKCFMIEDACEEGEFTTDSTFESGVTTLANTNAGVLGQYCAICGAATKCKLQHDCPNGTYCWKEYMCVESTITSPLIESSNPPSTLTASETPTGNYIDINIDAFITNEVDSSSVPTPVFENSLKPSQEVTMMSSSSHQPTSFEPLTELTDIIGLVEAVEFEFTSVAPTASPATNQPSPPITCEHTVSSFLCDEGYTGWKSRSSCREYYWCHNGCFDDVIYDCGIDLLFDQNLELCTFANQVECHENGGSIIDNPSQYPSLRPYSQTGATIAPLPKTNRSNETQYSGGVVGDYYNSTDHYNDLIEDQQSMYETPPWLLSTVITTSSTSSVLVAPYVSSLLTSLVVLFLLFNL